MSRSASLLLAAALDVALVITFAAVGRASHDSDVWTGLATTAWPFLAALVLGWLIAQGWKAPFALGRTGLPVWAVTLVGGMLLRVASGQGIAVSFVIVAGIVLAVFLLGWRLVALLLRRATTRRRAA
ncbi:DUF3054 domain-containing protein [Microbacterium hominis]|uniref:DUF3054 domain-containing protein n=1 Tax=Microbacterium hominis TaxID=162426 RepID=A0A134DGI9_9MICO|nr:MULTISPECIES: DUF3054 domain-containing protein [Microbacterium]AUG28897.1 DUF3054 domain-containing protein [Microbacterium hominis]KXC05666.1 hypothetical protein MhomT_09725 [Microbacterium hominis]QOC24641.1 DUF3054 domain-containing protein [Microbacterium hominis]QOC28702.1 DUF3054 domain-containing protein [Microbacterium hominis]QRY40343.1 DUF3054 domain-containing protein [Microbacterium hominis]